MQNASLFKLLHNNQRKDVHATRSQIQGPKSAVYPFMEQKDVGLWYTHVEEKQPVFSLYFQY